MLFLAVAGYAFAGFGATVVGAVGLLGRKKAGQVGFGLIFVAFTLPPWCLACALQLVSGLGALSRRSAGRLEITAQCVCWRLALGLCPWVRITTEGLGEYRRHLGTTGRPACIVCNHTSFMDTILATALAPADKVGTFKMIIAQYLKDMPIIGRIATVMGHLCVPFKAAGSEGGMEVDKDQVAKIMDEYEAYLRSGGTCAWFPEGTINGGDCAKVATFRGGGFAIAVRNDVEIWCHAFAGNAACWGKYQAIGGTPCHLAVGYFQLCQSSKTYLADSTVANGTERDKAIFLANQAQQAIQDAVDRFSARGFLCGDNTKKRRANAGSAAASSAGAGADAPVKKDT